ncbi:MAG TPA: TonB-dependent receptor [Chitinispirillaceae bacterium]|nr:TonB-dependent receptor [Chitinispirillaceae bacterium]
MAGYWIKRIITITIISSAVVNGNDTSNDTTTGELKKVVVSATRQSRSIHDIPVSATVIDKEQIEHSAAKNITDVLQYVMGVQVKCPVGMGEGVPSDIMMRGIPGALTATRVLILVDGIANNLSGTPFLLLNEIPLDAVKRVEVIRGPFSSIYGANAFGGVINIVTETGDGRPNVKLTGESSLPFTAAHNYGLEGRETGAKFWKESTNLAYWNISGVAGGGNDRVDILAAGGARTIGNYYLSDSTFARKGSQKFNMSSYNHDYSDARFFLKSGVRFNDKAKLNVHVRYFNSELGYGTTETNPDADVVIKGNKFLAGTFLEYTALDNLHLKIGGFGRIVGGDYFDRADSTGGKIVPTSWDVNSQDVQGEVSAVYAPLDMLSVIAGVDHLWSKITFGALKFRSSDEVRPGEAEIAERFRNTGVYAQFDVKLPYVNVVPALRLDYHSQFGWMFSPKIGVSSRLMDHLTLRSSFGDAFRAPSTVELYGNMIVGTYKIRGNPDLLAEKVRAFDFGFETDFLKNITLQSNFFYNDMDNLITIEIGTEAANNIVSNANLDDAWSYGVESEIAWNPAKSLNCIINYTFTESENARYKVPLDYIPKHKLNASVGYNKKLGLGKLHFSINEGFVGRRHYADWRSTPNMGTVVVDDKVVLTITPSFENLDPYFLTDISGSYTFKNNHEVAFNIINLFDAEIEQSGGNLLPGRFASLKYTVPIQF